MDRLQRLYELVVNESPHAGHCAIISDMLKGKPMIEYNCTCWRKEAIEIIEEQDRIDKENKG